MRLKKKLKQYIWNLRSESNNFFEILLSDPLLCEMVHQTLQISHYKDSEFIGQTGKPFITRIK